jgi:hypothetical protein
VTLSIGLTALSKLLGMDAAKSLTRKFLVWRSGP